MGVHEWPPDRWASINGRPTDGRRQDGSRKPEAGSRKPEAGSRKPEAGSRKPEAGKVTLFRTEEKCILWGGYFFSDYVESKNRAIRSFSPIKSSRHTHEHGSELNSDPCSWVCELDLIGLNDRKARFFGLNIIRKKVPPPEYTLFFRPETSVF